MTEATVNFYDLMRLEHTERGARALAELYLRRKVPGTDANTAAEILANALGVRAARRMAALAEPVPA